MARIRGNTIMSSGSYFKIKTDDKLIILGRVGQVVKLEALAKTFLAD